MEIVHVIILVVYNIVILVIPVFYAGSQSIFWLFKV